MKSNGLLKWLMLPVLLVVVFVGLRLSADKPAAQSSPLQATGQLTPAEMQALGIEGDTPRDTVATLVAQVKQLRSELKTALDDNTGQKTENDRLRSRERSIDQRIQATLDGERGRLQQDRDRIASDRQQTQGLLQDLQRRLDGLTGKDGAVDLPVGLGLEEGAGPHFATGRGGTRWIEPDDATPNAEHAPRSPRTSLPTSFGPAPTPASGTAPGADPQAADASPTPVYTVPTNATLMGSIAMTALVGRVPIDGTVNDPYPSKVLIGPDNLTANGIDLPDVAGAVVSGTASGDWTLSCVRGQIRSMTFVFHDGTIRTVPEEAGSTGDGTHATQGGLGWISDPYGVPCVSGERRSNAAQYLGSQALITAAGAGAASLIQSDNGTVSYISNGNGSLGTVGISGSEAMGRVLAGGVQEMSQWVNKLYGQAFAAIYVRPGAAVAVHLEQPLTIDYAPKGRRVIHRLGGSHAPDLD